MLSCESAVSGKYDAIEREISSMNPLKRAVLIYLRWGIRGIAGWGRALLRKRQEASSYQRVLDGEGSARPRNFEAFDGPRLSVLLPVYNVDEIWLRKCIDSVLDQTYANWELCIVDDASTAVHIRPILKEYASTDTRIKVLFRETNGHISAASNSSLRMASGEFCILLDHDDELSTDALFWVANEMLEHPDVAMIYSDEDLIDANGKRSDPKFKPDFSRDLFYSLNLVTHLSAYRTSILKAIGGFRVGLEGSQDYDLALRVVERINENQLRHIPRILYHWRAIPGSVALDGGEKPYAHERARKALREHFERIGVDARVEKTHFDLHRIRYELPDPIPKISAISWSDTIQASSKIDAANTYDGRGEVELITVEAQTDLAPTLNDWAAKATGDVLVFLRSGLESISEMPLVELVSYALQEDIGCVGGIVFGKNGTVEGGGLVLGGKGIANVAHAGLPEHMPGHLVRNLVTSNFSAVGLEVFAIRKQTLQECGGFDVNLRNTDLLAADLCLRVGKTGKRIVLTPYAKYRFNGFNSSKTRVVSAKERDSFRSKWSCIVSRDPFSNPNVKSDGSFSIII